LYRPTDFIISCLADWLPGQEYHIPSAIQARKPLVNTGAQPAFRQVALNGCTYRSARYYAYTDLFKVIGGDYEYDKRVSI